MKSEKLFCFASILSLLLVGTAFAQSGSTRPRRVQPAPTSTSTNSESTTTTDNVPASASPSSTASVNGNAPRVVAAPNADTARAYSLLQQKQYAAAAREAKAIATSNPQNAEAWKIAGFAEYGQQQYADAATDLQRALDLQRAAKEDDPNTNDALAQAYARTEQFERALPLLVSATTRQGARPDAGLFYLRGLAEYRTGKAADAERSFNTAARINPKDAASLFYLGRIAYERNDFDKTIAALNRATLAAPREPSAWQLLVTAYLRRAAASANNPARADADYLSAVRAGESLYRLQQTPDAALFYGQALLYAKQYPRAATVLETAAASADAPSTTLYLLGIAESRAKNFPKAISALERAAAKTPDDVNIYRELGYAYEVSKQYAKALAAYQKGADLAPNDTDFKDSVTRVKPFAK